MADYALWVRACETAIWQAGMHMAAYEEKRADAVEVVLEADPVAMALRRHMECRSEYTATATELLAALNPLVGDHVRRSRLWPASAKGLSGQITRLAPALRRAGITITHSRQGHTGSRLIHVAFETSTRGPPACLKNCHHRHPRRPRFKFKGLTVTQAVFQPSPLSSPSSALAAVTQPVTQG
jgi:hypothetical protein